ncbi:MAG: cysteine synthase A [Bdellovibrionales bacterium]|nr:cysteine synthase A [Bdellovibrionales bacterium]
MLCNNIPELIGNTPIVKIESLSRISGCDIFIKCENLNPGGSVKDRAALQMVKDAVASGELKPGMSIIEGTAGNTGIGLAVVAAAMGFDMTVVMPEGQAIEKQRMVELYGAKLRLVPPTNFKDPNHFYHKARSIAEQEPQKYWWANQFENLSNHKAHFCSTGPEIFKQLSGKIDALISVAGTGGTIAGTSCFLKNQSASTHVRLVDPPGSGLASYLKTGAFTSEGSSITEGIGIMRLVANFAKAKVDDAITLPDQDLILIANHVRLEDGLLLGSSAALNVAGAFFTALQLGPGKRLVTFLCDLGERSYSKLYNPEFLKTKNLSAETNDIELLKSKYKKMIS